MAPGAETSLYGLAPFNACVPVMARAWVFLLLTVLAGHAQALDFTLHELGDGRGNTLLVVGGIQGDEPGGFNAASLLVTHYRISNGDLWVVPNLNFESIVKRSRGVHGDMNRKFASLPASDPEYHTVQRIKRIILDPRVDLVLNLHDGSGFYRSRYQDRWHNPRRWGQSLIIDQATLDGARFGDLSGIAAQAAARANTRLHDPEHRLHVKNTRTREGDVEMAKTLTYFAVQNGKSAFGLESSKNLPTHLRVYYHLLTLEAFMDHAGIRYVRDFTLTPRGVKGAINGAIRLSLYGNRIGLEVNDARKRLGYFPIERDAQVEYEGNNPLLAVTPAGEGYRINYGNRRMTYLQPEYLEFDRSLDQVGMTIDGLPRKVAVGSVMEVREWFRVAPMEGYRVNVIGWRQAGREDDSGTVIRRGQIPARFSVDRGARKFRVELYRENRFVGMVLVNFTGEPVLASARISGGS